MTAYSKDQDCILCRDSERPWDVDVHCAGCYWLEPDYENELLPLALPTGSSSSVTTTSIIGSGWDSSWARGFCTHALDPYTLTDGTVIYLSGSADKKARTWEPDLAVYLAGSWVPQCVAFHIGWIDYGLPTLPDAEFLKVARIALQSARDGETVEVGCFGGHGRTGTMVAVLDCLSMGRADSQLAIENVRDRHCYKAIENEKQEWFVHYIAAMLNGDPLPIYTPPKPAYVAPIKTDKPKANTVTYCGLTGKVKKN